MKIQRFFCFVSVMLMMLFLAGCGAKSAQSAANDAPPSPPEIQAPLPSASEGTADAEQAAPAQPEEQAAPSVPEEQTPPLPPEEEENAAGSGEPSQKAEPTESPAVREGDPEAQPEAPPPAPAEEAGPEPENEQPAAPQPEPVPAPEAEQNGFCVVIDPGHQLKGNNEQEPIGPGATQTKAKVTSGTVGRFSGLTEYQLNLDTGLLLKDELEQRGYRVVMTRTGNDVDLSNIQRAQIAADAGADVFIRIHANGSDDPSVEGAMTICMTKNNPYCAAFYEESRRLSDAVLEELTAATGAKKKSVWETDTMSGINWTSMPVTIVEMGFMTNEHEDLLMATTEYQQKLAQGMAEGIDRYFREMP